MFPFGDIQMLRGKRADTFRSFVLVIVMAKEYARSFYSSKRWQDCRNEYARSVGFLCENCLRQGIYKPGNIVHHRIEIDPITINNPEVALNWNNLELLCRDCHAEAHDKRKKGRRYKISADGKINVIKADTDIPPMP